MKRLWVTLFWVACGAPPPVVPSTETDLAVVRFNSDGSLDTGFGTAGIARVDLSAADLLATLDHDAADRLVLFAGLGADRAVVRLTTTGALDPTFGAAGVSSFDFGGAFDNQRGGFVQPDGKIFSTGYSQLSGANQIVLLRLNADGTRDLSFGDAGVVLSHPEAPAGQSEVYGAGVLPSGSYLTAGHGRRAGSGPIDLAAWRFKTDGAFDHDWARDGGFALDLDGGNDRAHAVSVLADGSAVLVGSTGFDALAVTLLPDGAETHRVFNFGRTEQSLLCVSGLAAVGYRSAPLPGVPGSEDGVLVLLDGGFAGPVGVSQTLDDRLTAVAVGPDGKLYAAGAVIENGDGQMLVTRFNSDGSRDDRFGTSGSTRINVIAAGTIETATGVTILSNGQIVIAGTVEKR